MTEIATDAPHIDRVVATAIQRHRILSFRQVIGHHDPRCGSEQPARLIDADRARSGNGSNPQLTGGASVNTIDASAFTRGSVLLATGGGLDAPNSVVFRPTIDTNTDDFSKAVDL